MAHVFSCDVFRDAVIKMDEKGHSERVMRTYGPENEPWRYDSEDERRRVALATMLYHGAGAAERGGLSSPPQQNRRHHGCSGGQRPLGLTVVGLCMGSHGAVRRRPA